jgi:serine/threonine protein kinase
LAKQLDDASSETAQTKGVGTDGLMAPETYFGKASIQSDVYSMGCAIYDFATGHRPQSPDRAEWFDVPTLNGMEDEDPLKKFVLALTVPLGDDRRWPKSEKYWIRKRPSMAEAKGLFIQLVQELEGRMKHLGSD